MLQPPGASTGRSKNYQSRRKAQESPEQILRGLQKSAPNKRCADCNSKLPSCINLTVSTFICISCAGIHRELNHRVKGLGHSSFTPEEAEQMSNTDNDQVNKLYMARFNPGIERLRQPQDNSDLQLLRAWIKRKYHDKAWYSDAGGGQQPQPTMAQIPPKKKQQSQQSQAGDLLGAFNAPASSTNNQAGGWDAFGGSSQSQNQGFQANFPPQQPPPQQQQPAFAADFANFPPAPAPQQQNQGFANFSTQPQQQQNFANFSSAQAPQPSQGQQGFANFSSPQQQQQNFANFSNAPPHQQNQGQQGFANFSTPQAKQQQQNFTNFASAPAPQPEQVQQGFASFSNPQAQQQQQNVANLSSAPLPSQGQQGFANFSSPDQMNPQAQQQPSFANFSAGPAPQQAPLQQNQGQPGFANFPNPNQMNPQVQQMQGVQQGFPTMGQQNPLPNQDGFANFNQGLQQQPGQGGQQGFPNMGQLQSPPAQVQQPQLQQQGNFGAFDQIQQTTAPTPPQQTPQAQQMQQQPQNNFGSFDQIQQQQQGVQQGFTNMAQQQAPPAQVHQQQQQQGNFGAFDQLQQPTSPKPPQQAPQAPGQQMQQQQPQKQEADKFGAFDQLQQQQPQTSLQGGMSGSFDQTHQDSQLPAIPNMQSLSLSQPNEAFGDVNKAASLQMESKRSFDIPSPTKDVLAGPAADISVPAPSSGLSAKPHQGVAKFSVGQELYYKNSQTTAKAKIIKVHFDDALDPYYTVVVDGKEKQTDDAHLFVDHPIQSDIVKVLQSMSESQLEQVLQFVKRLDQSGAVARSGSVTPQPATPSRSIAMAHPTSMSPIPNISNVNMASRSPVPAPMLSPAPVPFPSNQTSDASNAVDNSSVNGQLSMASNSGMNQNFMGGNQGGFSIPEPTPQPSAHPVASQSPSTMSQNGVQFQQPVSMQQTQQQSAPSQTMHPQQLGAIQQFPNQNGGQYPGQMQSTGFVQQSPLSQMMQSQQQQGAPQQFPHQNDGQYPGQMQQQSMPASGFGQPQQLNMQYNMPQQGSQMPLSQQLQQQPQQVNQPPQGAAPQGNPFDFY